MKTYIKKSIENFYIDFPEEIDSNYWSEKIGTTYLDFLSDKWILLSDEQLLFHSEHESASIQEVLNMKINPIPERTLEEAKLEKKKLITQYDSSKAVNSFNIGNTVMWLNVEERLQLATQIRVNENIGRAEMTKWFNGISYTFPLNVWNQMLIALEVYAGDALNVTEYHKHNIDLLETIEEVDNYNYTLYYPEKLLF